VHLSICIAESRIQLITNLGFLLLVSSAIDDYSSIALLYIRPWELSVALRHPVNLIGFFFQMLQIIYELIVLDRRCVHTFNFHDPNSHIKIDLPTLPKKHTARKHNNSTM
jgi:hypothetical protein